MVKKQISGAEGVNKLCFGLFNKSFMELNDREEDILDCFELWGNEEIKKGRGSIMFFDAIVEFKEKYNL